MQNEADHGKGPEIENPTEQQISSALSELFADGGFIVLERVPGEYVQAAGNQIEYRVNERHFRSETPEVDAMLVGSIMSAYLRGDESWHQMTTWTDVTEEVDNYSHTPVFIAGVLKLFAMLALFGGSVYSLRTCD